MRIIHSILNILFPKEKEIHDLEGLSPSEFVLTASALITTPSESITSLFNYRDPVVQKALWELKYRGNNTIAKLFGFLLYEVIVEEIADKILFENFTHPLLIPLPLSKQRRKERGWNQSEMLVKEIISHDKEPFLSHSFTILIKHKHTVPQTTLSKKERIENLKGCFSINKKYREDIKNRNIILIDDVTTTGSTIEEARRTLLDAGAHKVIAYTIAH